ncbi:AMP-dependent synthetase/ligase [Penicillium verrucosum]|uniref:AMP-dependent synthetase/ligase n=1 Tax=Penicillium verrucosum TaxID=60171 RepID=UPI0025453DA2|nr:AMP-dependent synthetase/ligase [Penicillium verrucosum]KAJ5926147.1 AMP-dependent synthetase/ligase [Penicillium verrucosum]
MFEWTELEVDHWILCTEYDYDQIAPVTIMVIDQALRYGTREDSSSEGKNDGDENALCDRLVHIVRRQVAACLSIDLADCPCSVSFFKTGGTLSTYGNCSAN